MSNARAGRVLIIFGNREALKRAVESSLFLGEWEHYISRVSNSNADDVKQHTDFEKLQENDEVHPFTMINSALSLKKPNKK